MKRIILFVISALIIIPAFVQQAFAQQKIQYQLCNQDFRPLYMRNSLPENAVYTDTTATAAVRAHNVISRLTFDELLSLTGGWKTFYYPPVPRLGLRPIYFADGPQGIHIRHICIDGGEEVTSFPSELALVATWDPELAYKYANALGEEAKVWGISVLLGPEINLYRNSEGGRNFEFMGEDPFLASKMMVQYVKGLQSTGTLATPKTLICYNQEIARHVTNIRVGERALREIYLPTYRAVIKKGGAMALMTTNNFVNGYPGAANELISKDVIRNEYGFKGIIMSDWANSVFWPQRQYMIVGSGQSLLMSNNKLFEDYIREELKLNSGRKGAIKKGLKKMVFHNLYTFFKAGFYDYPYRDPSLVKKIVTHKKIALQTAEEAITLLKSKDNILPIKPSELDNIVVLGTDEALSAFTGGGSGNVKGYDKINYLAGLKNTYGNKIIHKDNISKEKIRSADVVLYFIYKKSGEGHDVPFSMPEVNKKINKYARLNKSLVVIYSGGNGFAMPWLSKVKGLVFAYLLGQVSGTAMANVISGKVNPSGKLPFTIEKNFNQSPAYNYNKLPAGNYYWKGNWKGSRKIRGKFGYIDLDYTEGVYIGYRWYDEKNIQPQFPFGFGLSYTTFKISDIKSSSKVITKNKPVMISFKVKNTGDVAGAEVAQLYIHKIAPSVERALKALKGFKRVFLKPGENKTVSIPVNYRDFAFWSTKGNKWKVNDGTYIIKVGTSSRDIRQRIKIYKR